MESTMLLEAYLKQLRLPTFLHNYAKFAEDAAQASLTYDRYLLALAERPAGREPQDESHQGGSLPGPQGTGRL